MSIEDIIGQGCRVMDIAVSETVVRRLADYVALLHRWNRVYNLTAVRQPGQMAVRHILDSLSVLPYIQGGTLLDVGSGAGLPGIPLAIVRPELHCSLLESNGKRVRFLRQACTDLALTNVTVLHSRIEAYHNPGGFDVVTARAFTALPRFVELTGRLCRPGGYLLAMAGRVSECQPLPEGWQIDAVESLHVPGCDAERHGVILTMTKGE